LTVTPKRKKERLTMTRKNLYRRTAAWAAALGSALTLGAPVATAMTMSDSGGAPASSGQAIQDGWLNSAIANNQATQASSVQDGWLNSSIAYAQSQQPQSLVSNARSSSLGPSAEVYATTSSSSSRDFNGYLVPVGGAALAALALASITLVVTRRGQKPTLAGA
jgi:hypothetical protein